MDVIRRTWHLGLGALSLTKEKAEELVDELIRRGEVESGEKFKTVDTLLQEAEQQEKVFDLKIANCVQRVVADMGLPTRKDIDEILLLLRSIDRKIPGPGARDVV